MLVIVLNVLISPLPVFMLCVISDWGWRREWLLFLHAVISHKVRPLPHHSYEEEMYSDKMVVEGQSLTEFCIILISKRKELKCTLTKCDKMMYMVVHISHTFFIAVWYLFIGECISMDSCEGAIGSKYSLVKKSIEEIVIRFQFLPIFKKSFEKQLMKTFHHNQWK